MSDPIGTGIRLVWVPNVRNPKAPTAEEIGAGIELSIPTDFGRYVPGGPCAHRNAVAVTSVVDGSVLTALCPDCDQQLSAAFLTCDHPNPIEISSLGEPHRTFLCNGCGCSYTTSR